MMSRKHYEAVAGVLRQQVDAARDMRGIEEASGMDTVRSYTMSQTLSTLAYNLVQKFYADNSRFDHVRFYEAAGFTVVGNYPLVFPEDY